MGTRAEAEVPLERAVSAVEYRTGILHELPDVFLAGYTNELHLALTVCREAIDKQTLFRLLLLGHPGNGRLTFAFKLASDLVKIRRRFLCALVRARGGQPPCLIEEHERRLHVVQSQLGAHDGPFLLMVKDAPTAFRGLLPDDTREVSSDSGEHSEDAAGKLENETLAWLTNTMNEPGRSGVLLFLSDPRQPLPGSVLDSVDVPVYLRMPSDEQLRLILEHVGFEESCAVTITTHLREIESERGVAFTSQSVARTARALAVALPEPLDASASSIATQLANRCDPIPHDQITQYEAENRLLIQRSELVQRRWLADNAASSAPR